MRYRDVGPKAMRRRQRWRELLLGEDRNAETFRHGDAIESSDASRQAGLFPQFYETLRDP